MEKVGNCVSPLTQAGSKGGMCSVFKEGGKVERDVNRGRVKGIGLEAQDKREEEREGDVIRKENKGRGKGPSTKGQR